MTTEVSQSQHWFLDVGYFLRIFTRTYCTCGWGSRPYWSLDHAADALIRHAEKAE
jgi:hypothetical protein